MVRTPRLYWTTWVRITDLKPRTVCRTNKERKRRRGEKGRFALSIGRATPQPRCGLPLHPFLASTLPPMLSLDEMLGGLPVS